MLIMAFHANFSISNSPLLIAVELDQLNLIQLESINRFDGIEFPISNFQEEVEDATGMQMSASFYQFLRDSHL